MGPWPERAVGGPRQRASGRAERWSRVRGPPRSHPDRTAGAGWRSGRRCGVGQTPGAGAGRGRGGGAMAPVGFAFLAGGSRARRRPGATPDRRRGVGDRGDQHRSGLDQPPNLHGEPVHPPQLARVRKRLGPRQAVAQRGGAVAMGSSRSSVAATTARGAARHVGQVGNVAADAGPVAPRGRRRPGRHLGREPATTVGRPRGDDGGEPALDPAGRLGHDGVHVRRRHIEDDGDLLMREAVPYGQVQQLPLRAVQRAQGLGQQVRHPAGTRPRADARRAGHGRAMRPGQPIEPRPQQGGVDDPVRVAVRRQQRPGDRQLGLALGELRAAIVIEVGSVLVAQLADFLAYVVGQCPPHHPCHLLGRKAEPPEASAG